MLPSFLAYVSQRYGSQFEDVATDALTFVLQNSSTAREALRAVLNEQIKNLLPPYFSVETRRKVSGNCVPDVVLRDPGDSPRVIIEAKFTAALTENQPNAYLDFLAEHRQEGNASLLVFLVPESRLAHYRKN